MSQSLPALVRLSGECDPARFEDVDKLRRRQALSAKQVEESQRLFKHRKSTNSVLTALRKQEDVEEKRGRRIDKEVREQRWTSKTQGSPFAVDRWAEDEKLTAAATIRNAAATFKERSEAKRKSQACIITIAAGLSEKDIPTQVSALQREKKLLGLSQSAIIAKQGMEKVSKRCEAVDKMQKQIRQELESRNPTLTWAVSDYYTMPISAGDGHPPGAYMKGDLQQISQRISHPPPPKPRQPKISHRILLAE